jgi:hypothetical protein
MATVIVLGLQKLLILRCSKIGIHNPLLAQHCSIESTGKSGTAMKYY